MMEEKEWVIRLNKEQGEAFRKLLENRGVDINDEQEVNDFVGNKFVEAAAEYDFMMAGQKFFKKKMQNDQEDQIRRYLMTRGVSSVNELDIWERRLLIYRRDSIKRQMKVGLDLKNPDNISEDIAKKIPDAIYKTILGLQAWKEEDFRKALMLFIAADEQIDQALGIDPIDREAIYIKGIQDGEESDFDELSKGDDETTRMFQ